MARKNKRPKRTDKRQGVDVKPGTQPMIHDLLCVRGPIYGPSGYSRMTRNIVEGLHRAEKRFYLDIIPWAVQPSIEVTPEFKNIFKSHLISKDEMNKTNGLLCICLPTDLPSRPIMKKTWLQTIFETTKIPHKWVEVLSSPIQTGSEDLAIKGLILPCNGNLESFSECPQSKAVIPLAIDYELFTPIGEGMELPDRSDFNILLSYHQNMRKNPEMVIRLINELGPDTTVYLKTFGIGMSTSERERITKSLQEKIESECKVVLLYDIISDEDQARLYRAMDLLVNVSHGEGWDLPRIESYSCGTPAIGPTFMGPADYTIDKFKMLSQNLVPCPDQPPFFESRAQWVDIDLIELMQAIAKIRNNYEEYLEAALEQRQSLIEYTGDLKSMGERIWNTVMC